MKTGKADTLVDIRDVMAAVDAENYSTPEDKIMSFVEKIKNPYEYRVGPVVVRTSFAGNMTMNDCFANLLSGL